MSPLCRHSQSPEYHCHRILLHLLFGLCRSGPVAVTVDRGQGQPIFRSGQNHKVKLWISDSKSRLGNPCQEVSKSMEVLSPGGFQATVANGADLWLECLMASNFAIKVNVGRRTSPHFKASIHT